MTATQRHRRAGHSSGAALVAVTLLLSACQTIITDRVNGERSGAGVPEIPIAAYLTEAGRSHSAAMCAAGAATPSPDPAATYGGETAVEVRELVGSAPLDPAEEDAGLRN